MEAPHRLIAALLLALGVFLAGNGLLLALSGLHLHALGRSAQQIGMVGGAYFAGFALAAVLAPRLLPRCGCLALLAAAGLLGGGASLALPYVHALPPWALLRALGGACVACVYIGIESWLNRLVEARWRGRLLGAYMATVQLALGLGPWLLGLGGNDDAGLFALGAALLGAPFALLWAARRRSAAADTPPLPAAATAGSGVRAPAPRWPLLGVLLAGFLVGASLSNTPLFLEALRFDRPAIGTATSALIWGGLTLLWPLSALADGVGRRVAIGVALAGTALSAGLCTIMLTAPTALTVSLALFGGFVFALYPLLATVLNDATPPARLTWLASLLNGLFSVGAALGTATTAPLARTLAHLVPG